MMPLPDINADAHPERPTPILRRVRVMHRHPYYVFSGYLESSTSAPREYRSLYSEPEKAIKYCTPHIMRAASAYR